MKKQKTVLERSCAFTISINGELMGLVSDDMGFVGTGIFLDEYFIEVWKAGLEALEDMEEPVPFLR